MNCQRLRTGYDEYRDGRLPRSRRQAIDAHLDRCGPCREFFRFQDELKQALSRMPARSAPADFESRLKGKLHAGTSGVVPFRPKPLRPLLWIAASLLLAAGLLLAVWRAGTPIRTGEPIPARLVDSRPAPEVDIPLPVDWSGRPQTLRFLSRDNQSGRDIMVEMPAAYTVRDFQKMETYYLQEVSH